MQNLQSHKLIERGHRKGGLDALDELKVLATAATIDLSSFSFESFFF